MPARKRPATTVTMKQHVNTTPHPDAIDLKDLVVDAPVKTAKPGENIPIPAVRKIKTSTEQDASKSTAPKEEVAKFAPTLTQPLASKPPSEQVHAPVQTAPSGKSDAPHYYDHIFIMEQLNKFVENPFDGEVASLPIPAEVIAQATSVVQELRDDAVEINSLSAELLDINDRMKTASSKFIINTLEDSYKDINRALSLLRSRRLRFHTDLDEIVRTICNEHQAQVTGYNDLVKGHIDHVAKQNIKQRKKIAKKNVPPAPKEPSPVRQDAQSQKEKSPEPAIPSPPPVKDSDAPPSPRPTESVPMASPARVPTAPASPAVVPPAPSPLKLSIDAVTRMADAGPSEHKSVSVRRSDFVVYGDEVISPKEELKYPYPREELPLFSTGAGAKGPLFNRNVHPKFFQASPYDGPHTSESPRFWTKEQAIYYSRVLYESKKIFSSRISGYSYYANNWLL